MSDGPAAPLAPASRIRLFAALITLYVLSTGLGALPPLGHLNASGIRDLGHTLVPPILPSLGPGGAELLHWLGTLPLELFFMAISLAVLVRGTGARLALCLYGMYLLHWICRILTTLEPPDQIVWDFPDWVLTFGRPGNLDFWFSGHVANAFIIALAARDKAKWMRTGAWLYLAFQVWLVLALRVHYSIDVIGGLFVAYAFHRLSLDLWARVGQRQRAVASGDAA